MTNARQPPLLVLVGPTAVGKTALVLPVARALGAEIVCVDSRQIYRYMEIGTAKPTLVQRAQVPHHLLDLLCPDQGCSAAQFCHAAQQVVTALREAGKRVLIVAGSGLYLQALLYGLMPAPAAHASLRGDLHAYADRHGTPALHRRLQQVDPTAAALYHPHDRLRLVRALEISTLTGEPFSIHCHRHQQQGPAFPYRGIGLLRERGELYRRIDARVEAMLAEGWLAEVEALLARGYTPASPAMNSLGYRELMAYRAGQVPWDATIAAIQRATRRFAKRQLTWFRKVPQLQWLDISSLGENTTQACMFKIWQADLSQGDERDGRGEGCEAAGGLS